MFSGMSDVTVQVRIPTVLRPLVGGVSVVESSGATVGALFEQLERAHPGLGARLLGGDGRLHPFVNVFVGDEDVRYLQGVDTPIPDGAEVSILPAVAGG